jgi:hypothetical protein
MTATEYKPGLGHQFKADQRALSACAEEIETARVHLNNALKHLPHSAEVIHMKVLLCDVISSAKSAYLEALELKHGAEEAYNQND